MDPNHQAFSIIAILTGYGSISAFDLPWKFHSNRPLGGVQMQEMCMASHKLDYKSDFYNHHKSYRICSHKTWDMPWKFNSNRTLGGEKETASDLTLIRLQIKKSLYNRPKTSRICLHKDPTHTLKVSLKLTAWGGGYKCKKWVWHNINQTINQQQFIPSLQNSQVCVSLHC